MRSRSRSVSAGLDLSGALGGLGHGPALRSGALPQLLPGGAGEGAALSGPQLLAGLQGGSQHGSVLLPQPVDPPGAA